MAGDITFTMIKPVAVEKGYIGEITKQILENGYRVLAMKMVHLTPEQAGAFYEVHKDKPFFDDLCEFMSSGPVVPIVLKKENAVKDYRKLIGATDPSEAKEGTIRNLYAESKTSNAVHGADSDKNALIEATFFFSRLEIMERE